MKANEKAFREMVDVLPDAKESKMFGATCIKAPNGKAVLMLYDQDIVFKLTGVEEKEALSWDGVHLFNPMGDRAMGGWVQVPPDYQDKWMDLAHQSMSYVREL